MPEIAEYAAAALIACAEEADGGLSSPRERLGEIIRERLSISFPEEVISKAVRILHRCDIAYSEDDDFAGQFIVISRQRFESFLEKVADDRARYDQIVREALDENLGITRAEEATLVHLDAYNRYPTIRKYSAFGREWLNRALDGIQKQPSLAEAQVPASDRIVRIDHNDPQVVEIKAAASDLRQRILRGNDLGQLSPEQAEAVVFEIEQIEQSFERKIVRPRALADRARRTLTWIGEKAAGTLVGKAALALLGLILKFFGF